MAVLSGDDAAWVRYGSAPLIVTLILPIVIGVILLLKCILNHCCVRKTTTKEEMYGVEGRMTILANAESSFVTSTPSQTQNLNSPPIATTVATATTATTTQTTNLNHHNFNIPEHSKNVSLKNPADCAVDLQACVSLPATDGTHQTTTSDSYETVDLTDSLKRTTLHRQLPDLPQIPQQVHNPPRRSSSVLSHDGTSELYATVGEVPNPATTSEHTTSTVTAISHYSDIKLRQKSKKSVLPSTSQGVSTSDVGPATKSAKLNQNEPTPSSDSETYATNHPYAKLKRNTSEHPYARVRTASAGNDEETDTDNYDIPQPYAQTRARPNNGPNGQQSSSNLSQPSASSSGSANLNSNGDNGSGPVPPRRVGRQWRRCSHPQAQNNVDNQSHFSGDSQDSRGYTSISVREPLSNIRSQVSNTRQYDSHYATVSDDSEEMYAAIEDPSDGNYQRIAGEDGDGRQLWLAGVNVASPIPERREANSPLPPPPVPPPPGEIATTVGAAQAASLIVQPQPAPVYAQVVKKSKKGKAPVTPTISNASVSSQIKENTTNDSTTIGGGSNNAAVLQSSSSVAPSTSTQASTHHQHHSKNRHTIMDSTSYKDPNTSETRRWSKADISYSEFEVVRETLFNNSNNNSSPDVSQLVPHFDDTSSTREVVKATETTELLDEDNYNVIADTFSSKKRGSKGAGSSQNSNKSKSRHTKSSDSNNYQEIEQLTNPYQEIRPKHSKETSSDHYQTIDLVREQGAADIYQEIDREKSIEDEEDEEEDQFYEKVKPSAKITASKSQSLVLPTSSASGSLDRKHGYEKLKKKGQPAYSNTGSGGDTLSINSPGTSSTVGVSDVDDDDEDEDEGKNDTDSLYERVKYPPYERLKESRDDLADDDDGNLYEAIGYSRVKSKQKQKYRDGGDNLDDTTSAASQDGLVEASAKKVDKEIDGEEEPTSVADLDQLYARVDKTKKKKNNSKINNDSLVTVCSNSSVMDSIVDGSLLDQETSENVNKSDTVVRKISSTGTGAGNSVQVVAEDNIVSVDYGTQTENTTQHFDNSIEYI